MRQRAATARPPDSSWVFDNTTGVVATHVPSALLKYLSGGWYCKNQACNLFRTTRDRADYYESYMRLMAHAVDEDR